MEENSKKIKRDRFVRIAERRVNEVLDKIDGLGKCSNRNSYEYNSEDIKRIFAEIEKKIKETRLKFTEKDSEKRKFKLS